MIYLLKRLVLSVATLALLVISVFMFFRIAQSDTSVTDSANALSTPVTTQSIAVTKNPAAPTERLTIPSPVPAETPDTVSNSTEDKKEQIWLEIEDAISGLNNLVGVEMFVDVKRGDKGQMEVLLDNTFWKRVRYQTRVELKNDISNLWHLYVTEYGTAGSSVVYFINETDGRVIDIFSRAR